MDMARIAIVVMVPIVALLVWRDWVLERQMRLLAVYDAAHERLVGDRQIAMRDDRIDDAMWSLLVGEPKAAVDAVEEVSHMPAPTPVPQRAWLLASAARCALGQPRPRSPDWLATDSRVRVFCTLNKPAAGAVKK